MDKVKSINWECERKNGKLEIKFMKIIGHRQPWW